MRALSLWQPWASLLAHGLKRVETRSWPYRGPLPQVLAVHATKTWHPDALDLCGEKPFREALLACGYRAPTRHGGQPGERVATESIPLGAVVGLVRLVACVGAYGLIHTVLLTPQERAFGDYTPGRYAWVCDRFLPLEQPIPATGRQGLWEWEPPLSLRTRQELGEWLAQPKEAPGD